MEQDSGTLRESSRLDADDEDLNHDELMEIMSTTLNDLTTRDPILSDLPRDVTLEEVTSQIAVQHGQSITVYVVRANGEEIPVVVNQKGARVIDLRRAVQRALALRMKRDGKGLRTDVKTIAWNYIWKKYLLIFDGEKLAEEGALLADIGIRNKARVKFGKRLREKGAAR